MSDFAIEANQLVKKFPARPGTGNKTESPSPRNESDGHLASANQKPCSLPSMAWICRSSAVRSSACSARTAQANPPPFACYVPCSSPPAARHTSMALILLHKPTMYGAVWARCWRANAAFTGSSPVAKIWNISQRCITSLQQWRGKEFEELIERMELKDRANELVEKYSTGMRQRVAIAKALLARPPILLLDEPTLGLDPQAARRLRELIAELKQEGHTILLTTHYMEEADQLSDRIGIIDTGQASLRWIRLKDSNNASSKRK